MLASFHCLLCHCHTSRGLQMNKGHMSCSPIFSLACILPCSSRKCGVWVIPLTQSLFLLVSDCCPAALCHYSNCGLSAKGPYCTSKALETEISSAFSQQHPKGLLKTPPPPVNNQGKVPSAIPSYSANFNSKVRAMSNSHHGVSKCTDREQNPDQTLASQQQVGEASD